MAHTQSVIGRIEISSDDLEVVDALLTSRMVSEAICAYQVLSDIVDPHAMVALANLRGIIAQLPDPPFTAGTGMDILATAGGYEYTGHSYRRLFDGARDVFGLEFVGGGTRCDAVVVHTAERRYFLHGDIEHTLDHAMLAALVSHDGLLDAILEGLQLLGQELDPLIYLTANDFPEENAVAAACEMFSALF